MKLQRIPRYLFIFDHDGVLAEANVLRYPRIRSILLSFRLTHPNIQITYAVASANPCSAEYLKSLGLDDLFDTVWSHRCRWEDIKGEVVVCTHSALASKQELAQNQRSGLSPFRLFPNFYPSWTLPSLNDLAGSRPDPNGLTSQHLSSPLTQHDPPPRVSVHPLPVEDIWALTLRGLELPNVKEVMLPFVLEYYTSTTSSSASTTSPIASWVSLLSRQVQHPPDMDRIPMAHVVFFDDLTENVESVERALGVASVWVDPDVGLNETYLEEGLKCIGARI